MGSGKSLTGADWGNMFLPGDPFDDTREKRESDKAIELAKVEAAKPRVNMMGASSSVGDTGGSSVDNIKSKDKSKKRKKRAGSKAAAIPMASVAGSGSTGLGGV
jgi:hypothetical protein